MHRFAIDHHRTAQSADAWPAFGRGKIDPHAPRRDLRVIEHLRDRVDRSGWHAGCLQPLEERDLLVRGGKRIKIRLQLAAVCDAAGIGLVPFVLRDRIGLKHARKA